MAVNARKALPWIAATAAVALTAVLLAVLWPEPPVPEAPGPEARAQAPAAPPRAPAPAPSPVAAAPAPAPAPAVSAVQQYLPTPPPDAPPGEAPPEQYPVDLELLRAKLPDNLYWEEGIPTRDPEVLKKRAEDKQRWNDLYGKVLSGMATEEEVYAYYTYRRKVSEDFIAFATTVLSEYGDRLPERDRGLYELSINMHRTRLQELPRQEADSLAHRQAQQQRREAWRQGQRTP